MTIEHEARDLLARYVASEGSHFAPLMAIKDALEQRDAERKTHADFRQRVSDAMEAVLAEAIKSGTGASERAAIIHPIASPFIIPKPVDPLVEAIMEMALTDATPEDAERLRAALAKRGLVVREEG